MLKGRVGVNREGQGENIQDIRTEHLELKKGFTEGYGHHIPSHMHTRILPNLTPLSLIHLAHKSKMCIYCTPIHRPALFLVKSHKECTLLLQKTQIWFLGPRMSGSQPSVTPGHWILSFISVETCTHMYISIQPTTGTHT